MILIVFSFPSSTKTLVVYWMSIT